MAVRLEAVSFDVADPRAVATFWAELLDRSVTTEPGGSLVPGNDVQVGLRFVSSDGSDESDGSDSVAGGRPRLHLHLTSRSTEDQRRTVERVLRLGGRHLDVGQLPDEAHVVLADPGGGELCVIEPDNGFLAGTGYLGEVTCAGSRDVGMFWRDALAWPLVWDHQEQTAIQSPLGGTKLSWDLWDPSSDASPVDPDGGRTRQRFDLVADDPDDLVGEADRLVSLGARRLRDLPDGRALADPDGREFGLRVRRPVEDRPGVTGPRS